jgi:carbon monoxide dehydrogenase subunit G
MGKAQQMSTSRSYTSRTGEVPCGDKDLYAFLTDVRNLKDVLPDSMISDWEATPDKCSFRVDKAGRVKVTLKEALPHTMVSYMAENLFTGSLSLKVVIESLASHRSKLYVTADINMNPLVRMIIGEAAQQYLDKLIDIIENYRGYDKIRGYSQSL